MNYDKPNDPPKPVPAIIRTKAEFEIRPVYKPSTSPSIFDRKNLEDGEKCYVEVSEKLDLKCLLPDGEGYFRSNPSVGTASVSPPSSGIYSPSPSASLEDDWEYIPRDYEPASANANWNNQADNKYSQVEIILEKDVK